MEVNHAVGNGNQYPPQRSHAAANDDARCPDCGGQVASGDGVQQPAIVGRQDAADEVADAVVGS